MSAFLPVAAPAQQPAMPVIGLISPTSREMAPRRMSTFRQGLNETGYVEGQSVAIEYRFVEGGYDLMPDLVADLLRRGVTLIATPGVDGRLRASVAAARTEHIGCPSLDQCLPGCDLIRWTSNCSAS